MPSVVFYDGKEIVVGSTAKNQAARNPENTIFEVKRLIGRTFDDPVVQRDMKLLPYKIVPDKNGNARVQIK